MVISFLHLVDIIAQLVVVKRGFTCFPFHFSLIDIHRNSRILALLLPLEGRKTMQHSKLPNPDQIPQPIGLPNAPRRFLEIKGFGGMRFWFEIRLGATNQIFGRLRALWRTSKG